MTRSTFFLACAITATLAAASQVRPLFEVVHDVVPVQDRGIARGAAWGDFDGDGDADLFVTRPTWEGRTQYNALYRNDGGGRFSRVAGSFGGAAAWEGAAWIDVDGDGDLDLHIVGREGAGSHFLENVGGGRLAARDPDPLGGGVGSSSMACWADADGDGLLDVFIVGSGDGRNTLFRSLGAWRFEPVPLDSIARGDGSARACAWADLDGDHLPELAIANARTPNVLLRNHGALRLQPDPDSPLRHDTAYGYGLSFTDVDEDGLRDLFVANFDAGNSLYLGGPDGALEPVGLDDRLQSAATKGHAWGDFDLDGRIDAYLGSGTPRPAMLNRLFLGSGSMRFTPVDDGEFAAHADTSAAVAAADYDLDGDLDLFVANWGGPGSLNRLYRNTASAGTRLWLRVRLEGTRSNRMGIGTRATLFFRSAGQPRRQHRWLDSSTGYAGQNEPVLHFGLGDAGRPDSLVLVWPSSTVDHIVAPPTATTVTVREGAGIIVTH